MISEKKKLLINILITILYSVFTFIIATHHEIWVDELQVWQLVKSLSLTELFGRLANEGHPALFYLLVMPFAKLNFSIFSMQILCWIFSTAGVFLLLQFSPFAWWCRIAIVLSSGFLYTFPVIARSYSLLPLLLFSAAIFYKKRLEKPVWYSVFLFLISQVHVIMFCFVSILTAYFGYEIKKENRIKKNNLLAFFIMCLGLFLVLVQLFGKVEKNACLRFEVFDKPILILNVFVEFFANTLNDLSKLIIPLLVGFLGIFFIYLFICLYKSSKKMFWLTFLSIGFQLGIYIALYARFIYATRIFSAYLILIFAFWVVLDNTEFKDRKTILKLNILITVYFLFSTYNGILNCVYDLKYDYSGTKSTVKFIKSNINPNNAVIFYQNPNVVLPVLYYLGDEYNLLYAPYKEKVKFVIWNEKMNKLMAPTLWTKFLNKYISDNEKYIKDKEIYIIQVKDFYIPIENTEIIFEGNGYKALFENFVLLKYKQPK